MRRRLRDHLLFLEQFRKNFTTTGAVLPSSRALAHALARPLREREGWFDTAHRPLRVLECGPGTGAVTQEIVASLGPEDRLDLVEANPAFAQRLEERFANERPFSDVASRCRVFCRRVEQLDVPGHYDAIVSGLPLNNFSVDEVRRVLATFEQLLRPGGQLSFFEYVAIRRVRGFVANASDRQRLRGIDCLFHEWFERYPSKREIVWRNVPPAWVHHVCVTSTTESRENTARTAS